MLKCCEWKWVCCISPAQVPYLALWAEDKEANEKMNWITSKRWEARSRLYRRRCLQVYTRWIDGKLLTWSTIFTYFWTAQTSTFQQKFFQFLLDISKVFSRSSFFQQTLSYLCSAVMKFCLIFATIFRKCDANMEICRGVCKISEFFLIRRRPNKLGIT